MRVLPIYNFYENRIKPVFATGTKSEKTDLRMTPPLACDTVSFGRIAEHAEQIRILMDMGLPDIWTGKRPISKRYFEELLQKREFNRPISVVLKTVRPLKESLHKVPLRIFEMLEEYAKLKPNAHLDEIFQQWAPLAHLQLKDLQDPIFEELKHMARKLPESEKAEFDKLMLKTKEQCENKPIKLDFNKRDFRYKLIRIAQRIRQKNVSEEVEAIDKIIKMSSALPGNSKKTSLIHKIRKIVKPKKGKPKNLINIFQQMKNFYERSVLNKDQELSSLFTDVDCQIHGRETFIPFGRYNFIEDIKRITKTIQNRKLANLMVKKATELPTADQEVSAFIVKASRKSSDKIGYDWIWGSVGNIDHLNVFCKGGKDCPSNYAGSTNYMNTKRGNKTVAQQLRSEKGAYSGCYKYVQTLIEFSNNGILRSVGFNSGYVRNFAKRLEKSSPKEKPLKFDLSELR